MRQIRIKDIFSHLLIILYIFSNIPYVSAQDLCYSSAGVFGIIVLSVFTTLFVIALTVAFIWFLWTKNHLNLDFILKTISKRKVKSQDKRIDLETAKHDYAFDNPYFEDEEKDQNTQKDTIILVEGPDDERQQNVLQMNKNNSQRNSDSKQRNGHIINNRFVKSLPLSAVFSNGPFKKSKLENVKSMDDYFVYEKAERLEVELIGRDFTGLGFNICGNMKDGIFIKNVLNRGPANDSGKIKSGDRIIGVNVSFEGMVFDDAVSILSYASPYNVRIQLEKCGQYSTVEKFTNNLNANRNLASNTNKSLVHPLYRSHSVDDLSRIAKEVSLSEKSNSSTGKNVIQKIKTEILNRIHVKSSNAEESHSVEKERPKSREAMPSSIEIIDTQIEYRMESPKTSIVETKPIEDEVDRSQTQTDINSETTKIPESQVKKVVPAKRKGKAPQPPSEPVSPNITSESESVPLSPTNGETIETKAQVHNEEVASPCHIQILKNEETTTNEESKPEEPKLDAPEVESQVVSEEMNGHLTDSTESIDSEEQNKSEELNSVPIRANSPQRVQSPTGKTKSSSMSDLTSHKSHKLQTSLLERAVSLDMNGQNLPEENLSHIHGNLLVLNDENTDSLPIISWSLTKQMKNDMNSSESTLNELNESLVSIELSEKKKSSQIDLYDLSKDSIKIDTNIPESQNFVSHITVEVPPITSTPLKTSQNSANETIDPFIQLDSSFTSSEAESVEQTLKETPNESLSDSRSDCESNRTEKSDQTIDKRSDDEVIELSENELDGVMMSHKDFLLKQAKTNGSFPKIGSVLNSGVLAHLNEPQYESLDFESWHYMSEDENSNISKSQNEPTLYKTALDITLETDSEEPVKNKRLPEVAGITLKTGENGQITNNVFISTTDSLADSSFSSSSSSPISK